MVGEGMDLTRHAGFFLEFYEDELDLDLEVNPSKRFLKELKDVVYSKEWFSKLSEQQLNEPLYLMFRDIARPGTKGTFNGRNIRVDITIIPARQLDSEPVKTLGHFHPISELGKPFPEIYQVLWGKALFLEFAPAIKDEVQDFTKIDQVNLWEAKTDNFVNLQAGGHITINPSKSRPLILLNLVYSRFKSIYDPIVQMKGAPYYYVEVDGELKFIKNSNYKKVPQITNMELPEDLGPLKQGRPIYKDFLNDPKFFNFLVGKPDKEPEKKEEEKEPAEQSPQEETQASEDKPN
jgi:glucose-6-phosphate isomerase